MRPRQEQHLSALCHLCNAVPLWGLLFCGWIWFQLREESRTVRREAQQAMMFHALLMSGLLLWILATLLTRILHSLSLETASHLAARTNDIIFSGLMLAYVAICLTGCWRTLRDQSFRYPLVRPRP